jgi:acetoin utilization deacetylase AcuC-like enzyme
VLIVHADRHRGHATSPSIPGYGRSCPEVPERIDRILAAVTDAGMGPVVPPTDFGLAPLEAVHDNGLLDHLRTAFADSRDELTGDEPYVPDTFAVHTRRPTAGEYPGAFGARAFDVSCPIFRGTWEASYQATQAALTAAEHVRTERRAAYGVVFRPVAYALVRPPGHHAGPTFHGGFCYTNHAAAAARYLQQRENCRVAVLDIDYHHGNGTQEIFYADPDVFFVSLHADPRVDYPYYWGLADERGEGPGEGRNRNVPLPHGTDDDEYLAAIEPELRAILDYAPKYLVLSAGFDLMAGDPVPRNGGFRITVEGLRRIAGEISALRLPTVVVQEGGYNLDRLGEYAVALLGEFR